jgi:hypothetical protein
MHQITTVTPSNSIVALHQITMANRASEVQSKIAMGIIAFVDGCSRSYFLVLPRLACRLRVQMR